jgi:hypothetical protein
VFLEINGATASQEATIRSILEGDQLTWDRRRLETLVRVHMANEVDLPGDGVDNSAYVTYDAATNTADIYLERRLEADPAFFRRVIAHELGHVVIAHLTNADRQWFSEQAFGKPFSEWETGSWEQRPEEATAEAFVDAFLVNAVASRNASRLRVPKDKWSEALTRFQSFSPPPGEKGPPERVYLTDWGYQATSPVYSFRQYPSSDPFYRVGRTMVMARPTYTRARTSDYIRVEFHLKEALPGGVDPIYSEPEDITLDAAITYGRYTDGTTPGAGTPMEWTTGEVVDEFGNLRTFATSNIKITRYQQVSPNRLVEIANWFQQRADQQYALHDTELDMSGVELHPGSAPGTITDGLWDPRGFDNYNPEHLMFGVVATAINPGVIDFMDPSRFDIALSVEYEGLPAEVIDYFSSTPPYPIYDVAGRIQAAPGPGGVVPRRRRLAG